MIRSLVKILLLALVTLVVSTGGVYSQIAHNEIGTVASDTVFVDIRLSDKGIIALDSLGNRWEYHFSEATFFLMEDGGRGWDIDNSNDIILPVEERCVEEIFPAGSDQTVLVKWDQYVEGNITANRRITVKGWVKGSVRSRNGLVVIAASGQVDGDIRAPEIIVRDGGRVLGDQIISEGPLEIPFDELSETFSASGLIVVATFTLFFLVAGLLMVAIMPKRVRNSHLCISRYQLRSFLVGLLTLVVSPLWLTLVAITIVGILLIPMLPLVLMLALTLTMISWGIKLTGRFFKTEPEGKKDLYLGIVGSLLIMLLWSLVAIFLGVDDEDDFGIAMMVFANLVTFWALCTGVGATVLTRGGSRKYVSRHDGGLDSLAPAPAPPPIPTAPDVSGNSPESPPEPPPLMDK